MRRLGLLALLALGAVGCGSSQPETILVANVDEDVPVGPGFCVEGPYVIPDGASIEFDISDTIGDDMDVSVVADGDPCDGSSGFGVVTSTSWAGGISSSTGSLAAGAYDLAITCYNGDGADCLPFLHSFGYVP